MTALQARARRYALANALMLMGVRYANSCVNATAAAFSTGIETAEYDRAMRAQSRQYRAMLRLRQALIDSDWR